MTDYKTMYLNLFNSVTDAIEILQQAQVKAEEMYISTDLPETTVLQPPDADGNEN